MGLFTKLRKLHKYWSTKRFLDNIKFLIKYDIQVTIKDEVLEDCVYELDELRDYLLARTPKILNGAESLALLGSHPKSFARFGDGEVHIMLGNDQAFQKYEPLLAEKLLRVLRTKRDDLYVGINRTFFSSVNTWALSDVVLEFHRRYDRFFRRFFICEANPEMQYLDANCLMGYFTYDDNDTYSELIRRKRKLFEGRKVAIVTGKSVLAKLDYDIFGLASSKVIIDAPSKNAFSAYDEILRDISRNVSKDTLICLILGQTATVMAADLADMGYVAWDVGHMAKDYDFYMKNHDKTDMGDFFAPD